MLEYISNKQLWELTGWIVVLCMLPLISRAMRDENRTALEKVAMTLGFSFEEDGRVLPPEIPAALPIFKIGDSREVSNLLYKAAGSGTMYVFEYVYHAAGPGGGRSGNHHQVVAVFPFSGSLPNFQLSPERLSDKVRQLFGYQDIDFPDSPEFSSQYLLRGEDEAAVRGLFSPEARSLLSGMPGWHVEGAGAWLAMYKTKFYPRPENYQDYIKQAGDISSVFGGPRA